MATAWTSAAGGMTVGVVLRQLGDRAGTVAITCDSAIVTLGHAALAAMGFGVTTMVLAGRAVVTTATAVSLSVTGATLMATAIVRITHQVLLRVRLHVCSTVPSLNCLAGGVGLTLAFVQHTGLRRHNRLQPRRLLNWHRSHG